jgi:tetratricopeptide (TPR) repeat protein
MAGRLLDSEPDLAYAHATAARRMASRLASTREAAGLAAYLIGRYSEALAQLRAARRISGSAEHLPVMADCERGLGRPDRALATAADPAVAQLDRAGQVEMRIVAAGARRDMGQLDAAVVTLQGPDLSSSSSQPWTLRLWYAYADALSAAGRPDEAREWFARVVERDGDGETDAELRLAEIDGIVFTDALGDDDEEAENEESGAGDVTRDGAALAQPGDVAASIPPVRFDDGGEPDA